MTKIRIAIFFTTVLVVGTLGWFAMLYARGYRFNQEDLSFEPNGLLVIKSYPDGAQVIIDGELTTATNTTIALAPATYDVTLKKEGYLEWKKRLNIDKEIVTETTAHLFKVAPSLSAITFNGAENPVPSNDMSKIAYAVPIKKNNNEHNTENAGLWILENVNLPIGFSREPRRITDGDLSDATWKWSPNDRELLLTTPRGTYLLEAGTFTPQNQRINIASIVKETQDKWGKERQRKLKAQIRRLPEELKDILERKTNSIVFSADKDMILYTASSSATLPNDLIKPVPGASTQKQERNIKPDHTYVYDIKEDRNFLIDENSSDLIVGELSFDKRVGNSNRRLAWFPTSRHLILAEKEKITIMDYDNTNRQEVYKGSYVAPHAFPALSTSRLIILTNLGANSSIPNLYSLSLK